MKNFQGINQKFLRYTMYIDDADDDYDGLIKSISLSSDNK